MKLITSFFVLVLVIVGAVPPGHFTLPGHVIVRNVPSAVKITVNPTSVSLFAGVFEIVKVVMLALRLTKNTCDVFRFNVSVPDEIVGALVGSRYFVSVRPEIVIGSLRPPVLICVLLMVVSY